MLWNRLCKALKKLNMSPYPFAIWQVIKGKGEEYFPLCMQYGNDYTVVTCMSMDCVPGEGKAVILTKAVPETHLISLAED